MQLPMPFFSPRPSPIWQKRLAWVLASSELTQDGEVQDGQYNRQFLFNGTPVGTAVMSVTSPEEDTAVIEASTQNLTNAQDYTVSHTSVPYFVIGGIGLFLLLLILFRIVKVAKS